MSSLFGVLLCRRKELNTARWDERVFQSAKGKPYAYTWYLDEVAPKWLALVSEDGGLQMPVPLGSFFWGFRQMMKRGEIGWRSVVQPLFCQQLGVLGEGPVGEGDLQTFSHALKRRFPKIVTYCFSEENGKPPVLDGLYLRERSNYLLDLNRSYAAIFSNYSKSHRRILKKSQGQFYYEEHSGSVQDFLHEHARCLKSRIGLSYRAYRRWGRLILRVLERKQGKFVTVRDTKKRVCAQAFVLHHRERIIYQGGYVLPTARIKGCMHVLFDELIRRYAERALLLDFEGSDLPQLAEFFRRFGAKSQAYFCLSTYRG